MLLKAVAMLPRPKGVKTWSYFFHPMNSKTKICLKYRIFITYSKLINFFNTTVRMLLKVNKNEGKRYPNTENNDVQKGVNSQINEMANLEPPKSMAQSAFQPVDRSMKAYGGPNICLYNIIIISARYFIPLTLPSPVDMYCWCPQSKLNDLAKAQNNLESQKVEKGKNSALRLCLTFLACMRYKVSFYISYMRVSHNLYY